MQVDPRRPVASDRLGVGVGVLFNPALAEFVSSHLDSLDYLAVIPIDSGSITVPARLGVSTTRRRVRPSSPTPPTPSGRPLTDRFVDLHAGLFDRDYLSQLRRWRERYACPWVSEHLSFSRIGAGHETNAAVALPVPHDREILTMLGPRIKTAQATLGCPFLLENNVSYVTFPQQDLSEAQFLNELTSGSGCSLLLDLHNV